MNRVLVTILTWNKVDILKDTINSFLKFNSNEEFDIIVLDNGSTDGTSEYLKSVDINFISNKKNEGIYRGTMALWQKALDGGYDFILNIQNDFVSSHRTPLKQLKQYMDNNLDVGFVRLNDKKDLKKNSVTHKKIRYHSYSKIDEFDICKFNYHFSFNPYLFRSSYVPFFMQEPLNLKAEKNESILQKRYNKHVGLLGARILNNHPFKTLPSNHHIKGWLS